MNISETCFLTLRPGATKGQLSLLSICNVFSSNFHCVRHFCPSSIWLSSYFRPSYELDDYLLQASRGNPTLASDGSPRPMKWATSRTKRETSPGDNCADVWLYPIHALHVTWSICNNRSGIVSSQPNKDLSKIIELMVTQWYIFRLTCSQWELTKDHVLTSGCVKIFRTITRYAEIRVSEGKKMVLDFP